MRGHGPPPWEMPVGGSRAPEKGYSFAGIVPVVIPLLCHDSLLGSTVGDTRAVDTPTGKGLLLRGLFVTPSRICRICRERVRIGRSLSLRR